MGALFVYILKSSVCLIMFYLFYRLLLSKETFHRFNRFALLGVLLLSLVIPLIEVTAIEQTAMAQTMLTWEQLMMMADFSTLNNGVTDGALDTGMFTLSGIQVALLVYLAGVLSFACFNFYSIFRLLALLRSGRKERLDSSMKLVIHQKEIAPFSWMNYVVISSKDMDENGREILIHEMAHIRNRHSIDLLMADICVFFQWFNPAAWLLKQELQNIHEYEADETVIKEGIDAKHYQLLIIKKAVGTRLYSMANSFNHSTLKKRITMMLKEKSNPWARLKYLYVLPLAAIAITAFARPEISETANEISAVKVNDLTAIVETKVTENVASVITDSLIGKVKKVSMPDGEEIFSVVEQMPEYPGGGAALRKYLEENLIYPKSAKEKGIQGRVVVQFTIDKAGQIISPKIARSVDASLDQEAIRLVKAMPKWKPAYQRGNPVAVRYTVPVMFRIDGQNTGSEVSSSSTGVINIEGGGEPLVIVDGIEFPSNKLNAIDANWIKSIEVLKDASAEALYGDKGKNGVIVVTLKTKEEYEKNAAQKDKETATLAKGNEVQISGQIKDVDGNPVVGAVIKIEGTNKGTVTDNNGAFAMLAPKGSTLTASFISMQTSKIKVNDTKPFVIILKKE